MAGLSDSLIAERTIKTSGGDFTVRGIGVDAILGLFARRRGDLAALFDKLVVMDGDTPKLSLDSGNMIGALLLHEAPGIAAELIAMGAGDVVTDNEIRIARALSFPVQLAAIEAVAELTFTSDMPPKKVLEAVVSALGGLASTATALLGSPSGSGESGDDSVSSEATGTPTPASTRSDG